MAGGGVQTAHVVGWIVTGLAFGGNLLWNWLNRRHSNRLAATLRKDQYKFDVWERFRARIEERLETLVGFVCGLPAQIAALPSDTDFSNYLNVLGHTLVSSQDELARVLLETDASEYCNCDDWGAVATGQQKGVETSWDQLLAAFEDARAIGDADARLNALRSLKFLVLEIEQAVREKIRIQDCHYEP